MYTADESENALEALLADAQVLADYDPDIGPSAAERIARFAARNQPDLVVCHATHSDLDEQARRQLDLISARVLNTPQAAACLSQLGITDHGDPAGAMVFACLLYLTGREEGARFWWKFAAGSGDARAAECLALQYECDADYFDARQWRAETESLLKQQGEGAPQPTPAPPQHPLLPEDVAKQLLEQCRQGLRPRLPTQLEEAVNDLVIEDDDEQLGPIPRPAQHHEALGAHH